MAFRLGHMLDSWGLKKKKVLLSVHSLNATIQVGFRNYYPFLSGQDRIILVWEIMWSIKDRNEKGVQQVFEWMYLEFYCVSRLNLFKRKMKRGKKPRQIPLLGINKDTRGKQQPQHIHRAAFWQAIQACHCSSTEQKTKIQPEGYHALSAAGVNWAWPLSQGWSIWDL